MIAFRKLCKNVGSWPKSTGPRWPGGSGSSRPPTGAGRASAAAVCSGPGTAVPPPMRSGFLGDEPDGGPLRLAQQEPADGGARGQCQCGTRGSAEGRAAHQQGDGHQGTAEGPPADQVGHRVAARRGAGARAAGPVAPAGFRTGGGGIGGGPGELGHVHFLRRSDSERRRARRWRRAADPCGGGRRGRLGLTGACRGLSRPVGVGRGRFSGRTVAGAGSTPLPDPLLLVNAGRPLRLLPYWCAPCRGRHDVGLRAVGLRAGIALRAPLRHSPWISFAADVRGALGNGRVSPYPRGRDLER